MRRSRRHSKVFHRRRSFRRLKKRRRWSARCPHKPLMGTAATSVANPFRRIAALLFFGRNPALFFRLKPGHRAGLFSFLHWIYFMTDATTRKCGHCGERFTVALRQGKDSYRARAGRERSYQDQRYCAPGCRKAASKARRTTFRTHGIGPATPLKEVQGTNPFSGVATTTAPISLASISGAQKPTRPPLHMTFDAYTVVPDPEWPAMYRVRRPDGSLTDMANLTRARDAARCFAEQERCPEPLAIAA
jgi:hypothetical protein